MGWVVLCFVGLALLGWLLGWLATRQDADPPIAAQAEPPAADSQTGQRSA
jgi:hypothetical protein